MLASVTFIVKPSVEKRYRPMTDSAEEFIRRFLQRTDKSARGMNRGLKCWLTIVVPTLSLSLYHFRSNLDSLATQHLSLNECFRFCWFGRSKLLAISNVVSPRLQLVFREQEVRWH